MFMMNFYVRGREAPIMLRFRAKKTAIDLLEKEGGYPVFIFDDFGTTLSTPEGEVVAVTIVDVDAEIAAQGELSLISARANAKLQSQAQADPALRMLQSAGMGVPPFRSS